jgi:hypothetical protein
VIRLNLGRQSPFTEDDKYIFTTLRNKARWLVLIGSVAHLIVVFVYVRVYFSLTANHPDYWTSTLVDAGPVFHYLWASLALMTIALVILTVPKWQSILALLLWCVAIYMRVDWP